MHLAGTLVIRESCGATPPANSRNGAGQLMTGATI
jgi:hypothetical protein